MNHSRPGSLAGIALVGALTSTLALAGCGSDSNTADTGATGGSSTGAAVSGTLKGEGSTAQKNAITEIISSFQKDNPQATINYNATGSGAGIKQFNAGQVDFAGSDSALKKESKDGGPTEVEAATKRCSGNPAWNLPMVAGPIAVSYNLPTVKTLVLPSAVVAKIFSGKITTWNDPAIAAANAGATLPATAIKVFYRSDESGTSENFQKWLHGAAAADWDAEPAKKWAGTTGEGKPKSDGVASAVKATEGGIGYMEWSFAKDNGLGVAQIDNGGGAVELTGQSAGAAITAAKASGEGNDLRLTLDYATKTPGTYPIVLVTYEIVCSKGLSADTTKVLKSFLKYFAADAQQKDLAEFGYAPLPAETQTKVAAAIDAIS